MNRINLINTINDNENFMNFMEINGFRFTKQCEKCNFTMFIEFDNLHFRCYRRQGGIRCNTRVSYFNNSHLMYKSKIELKKMILLIYEFSANTNVKNTAFEYNLDSSTVSRYFDKFREITINHYKRNQPLQIGGDGVIVEWDECLLVKNKNHTGRILAGQKWIFGGVEKNNPSQVFFEHVTDRSAATLAEVVRRRVRPGSIIYSDCWAAYPGIFNILSNYNFIHYSVNHSQNFVNPITGVHTQTIEGTWSFLKRNLRRIGTNNGNFEKIQDKLHEIFAKKIYDRLIFNIILVELLQ